MCRSHYSNNNKKEEKLKEKTSHKRKSCDDNQTSEKIIPDPICEDKPDPVSIDKGCQNIKLFYHYLENYIGQTVTIFTTSGGQSGSGFTGVLMSIECDFLRLLTQIGPSPGCALGNSCSDPPNLKIRRNLQQDTLITCTSIGNKSKRNDYAIDNSSSSCNSPSIGNISPIGSVVIIPLNSLVAFVHNAIGSNL